MSHSVYSCWTYLLRGICCGRRRRSFWKQPSERLAGEHRHPLLNQVLRRDIALPHPLRMRNSVGRFQFPIFNHLYDSGTNIVRKMSPHAVDSIFSIFLHKNVSKKKASSPHSSTSHFSKPPYHAPVLGARERCPAIAPPNCTLPTSLQQIPNTQTVKRHLKTFFVLPSFLTSIFTFIVSVVLV